MHCPDPCKSAPNHASPAAWQHYQAPLWVRLPRSMVARGHKPWLSSPFVVVRHSTGEGKHLISYLKSLPAPIALTFALFFPWPVLNHARESKPTPSVVFRSASGDSKPSLAPEISSQFLCRECQARRFDPNRTIPSR